MKLRGIRKWAALIAVGGALFQTNACTQNAAVITSASSIFTAAGVFYLAYRVATD